MTHISLSLSVFSWSPHFEGSHHLFNHIFHLHVSFLLISLFVFLQDFVILFFMAFHFMKPVIFTAVGVFCLSLMSVLDGLSSVSVCISELVQGSAIPLPSHILMHVREA